MGGETMIQFTADDVRNTDYERLFKIEETMRAEICRRAWLVLKELGYEWYREGVINVYLTKRGKLDLIKINATAENNHQPIEINAELPLKQFNMLLQKDFAA
jgi:hypothetical protein